MKNIFSFPSRQEILVVLCITLLFCLLTAYFVGLRPEHILLIFLWLFLFFSTSETRKLAVGLLPFVIFGISYDWMRVYPNYMVNTIDVENIYNLEKEWFGININGQRLIPCEYFAVHNNAFLDFISGIFYLGWVPLPMAFALYVYLKKERDIFLRFSMVFLFVNLIGFAGYYIYPAAPPWYAMMYGFEPILDTPGNTAGLGRFDTLTGLTIFNSIYGRNANVFAAVPSLHSAYLVVTLYYAVKRKSGFFITFTAALFMIGIWFTAVYSSHHYIIDVILGTLCALIGIAIFEGVIMKLHCFRKFFYKYLSYIN